MFVKRDEWFQHEMQNHRVEYSCGQQGHSACTDPAAFVTHMRVTHEATVDSAQEQMFLSMFQLPTLLQNGTCCLCHREAGNLKTHLAHHLEQIALFALPRENEVPGMDSGINVRGSKRNLSQEGASEDSISEQASPHLPALVYDTDDMNISEQDSKNEEIDLVDHAGPEISDVDVSWARVYKDIGKFDGENDRSQLEAFAISSGEDMQSHSKATLLIDK